MKRLSFKIYKSKLTLYESQYTFLRVLLACRREKKQATSNLDGWLSNSLNVHDLANERVKLFWA